MQALEVDFKFHNVGQGLFYTGRLKYGRASFNFVYDCGSEKTSLAKDAINGEFQPDEKIDLLIVSHLHKDHTSGIPHLFKRVNNVDTVILPYLSPFERLIVALMTPRASQEYYHFLADPVAYFLEHGVRQVVLVGGEEADRRENWMPPFEGPSDLPPDGRFRLTDELPLDEELEAYVKRIEEGLSSFIEEGYVKVRNHSGILKVSLSNMPIWAFRLFNYKMSSQTLTQFEYCIQATLGGIDSRRIKNAIVSPPKRRALKSCYDQLAGGSRYLNNTSILVVHRPAFRPHRINSRYDCIWCPCCCPPYLEYYFEYLPCCPPFEEYSMTSSDFAQFLTGDIDLNFKFNEISQHFGLGTTIKTTAATLVPHHGSPNNWNNALCNKITSNFWVISAGIRNRYGHPSHKVLWDVCTNCQDPCVVWVNEATYFRLMGTLQF